MALIELGSPLRGWVVPLDDVPDPVFSAGLAGAGLAIDPVDRTVYAPCEGMVILMPGGRHAITVRGAAGDVLIHVGIDTVAMGGEGFRCLVSDGEAVVAGQPLLEFDLTAVARRATSAITPVLVAGASEAQILHRAPVGRIAPGDRLFAVAVDQTRPRDQGEATPLAGRFRVPFEHGLHARPAAQVVAALTSVAATVRLHAKGRDADARSAIALMSLGLARGDVVEVRAGGSDASTALAALAALLEPVVEAPRERHPAPQPAGIPLPGTALVAVVASRGLALGVAAPLGTQRRAPCPARGDGAAELHALGNAWAAVDGALAGIAARSGTHGVVDAHRALLSDPGLRSRARVLIERGASAGEAWHGALEEAATALATLGDPRMAERRADLLDLEQQVLAALAGEDPLGGHDLPSGSIVLADELLPSQLLCLEASRVAAIATAGGGPTAHVAILAAARGLPMLVAAGPAVLAIKPGTALIVDAEAGRLHVSPDPALWAQTERRLARRHRQAAADQASATEPACTRDARQIHIYANLGRADEGAPAVAFGAEGCGLLRTEFLFLDRAQAPTVAEQATEYARLAVAFGGRPLTIRTLDAGGDKPIPYLPLPREENPALGLRGLRTGQMHPEVLGDQLDAILAGGGPAARVLLPMVTEPGELRAVRRELERRAALRGVPAPALGVMIETPASALLAAEFAREADFLSVGSNDLAQYTLAMDRMNPALAPRLDGLHPAVLRLMHGVASAGRAAGREVAVCGGLASDPEAVPILVGLGIQELSAVPAMIPRLKGLVRSLDATDCERLATEALQLADANAVRDLVRRFRHDVDDEGMG